MAAVFVAVLLWIRLWLRTFASVLVSCSRTGTGSMAAALEMLGYRTYHFCASLVQLDPTGGGNHKVDCRFADAFDAHTGMAPSLVYKELAARYPDAKFVLTTRDACEWGRAMVRFTQANQKIHWSVPLDFF
jgi:hypothetical protein